MVCMPKAVRFYELGGPEVLKIEEVPLRQPQKGEVVIDVAAVGLNRAESMFFRGSYIYQPNLPAGLGYEVAGRVTAVGSGVDPSWVGKRVGTIPGFSMNHWPALAESAVVPKNVRTLSGTAPNRKASSPSIWWAVSIGPFQVGRPRLRRMRFAMGIQSYFCCLTASRLPGNGIVERSSRSRWLHYAPGAKVLRPRKCLLVGTRSVRRASGLLETPFSSLGRKVGISYTCPP